MIGSRRAPERPRLARLRPGFAAWYPGIVADVWVPASDMVDMVWGSWLRAGRFGASLRDRVLNAEHFEFRHGSAARGHTAPPSRSADRGELFG
jgi:hypothetical protein